MNKPTFSMKKLSIALLLGLSTCVGVSAGTTTCYNTCNPSFGPTYVGTETVNPQCNGSSPSSYDWSLTVNGTSISGTKTCAAPPSVNIGFSLLNIFKSLLPHIFIA